MNMKTKSQREEEGGVGRENRKGMDKKIEHVGTVSIIIVYVLLTCGLAQFIA